MLVVVTTSVIAVASGPDARPELLSAGEVRPPDNGTYL
jgi:hypothetical protein